MIEEVDQRTATEDPDGRNEGRSHRLRNALIFLSVGAVWLGLDQFVKSLFEDEPAGTLVAGPYGGIFQFSIVHNTGGAWGIFGGSTLPIAIVSIIVCLVLVVFLFGFYPRASVLVTVGIALICAGGVGNVIDRLSSGYVLDFIDPVFIDFPVFNIADIGVTVGVILLIIGYFAQYYHDSHKPHTDKDVIDKAMRQ